MHTQHRRPTLHCNCADHTDDTSETCAAHDPQSVGECHTCLGALYETGFSDFSFICSACGDEF